MNGAACFSWTHGGLGFPDPFALAEDAVPLDLGSLKIDRSSSAPSVRRQGRRGIGWLVLLAIAGGGIWLFGPRLMKTVDQLRLPEVEVARAIAPSPLAASAVEGTAANGYLVASKRAALSADTPGRIVEMNVTEGSVVKKGFVVARLYSDEYRAALARTEADLAAQATSIERVREEVAAAASEIDRLTKSAEAAAASVKEAEATRDQTHQKLERAEKMVTDHVESQQWLDDARAADARAAASVAVAHATHAAAESGIAQAKQRFKVQEAALLESQAQLPVLTAVRDQAKATLDKTEVRAPFDGVVVLKDAEVGEVVSPNSQGGASRGSVATMVDFATLEVQVEMPERNIAAVQVAAATRIFLDAYPDRPYAGRVTRIWPVASRSKGSIEVRVRFDAPDDRLRPEMGARVVFLVGERPEPAATTAPLPIGVFVPSAAIVHDAGKIGVYVVERDRVRFAEVAVGEERAGRTLVTRGLVAEEQVVVAPPSSLQDGDRIRAKGDA